MKVTFAKMLRGAAPNEEMAQENESIALRLLKQLDKRIAKKEAEAQLRELGYIARANGHK